MKVYEIHNLFSLFQQNWIKIKLKTNSEFKRNEPVCLPIGQVLLNLVIFNEKKNLL